MRFNLLILLALLLCLAPAVTAQEQAANVEGNRRRAEELLALSVRQNPGNHPLALKTAAEALALSEAAGDREGIARANTQIALCHLIQSDLPEATRIYEQVLQQWRDLGDPKQEASILIKLSFIEIRKGEWSAAISRLTQAKNLLTEADATQMGQIASALGDIFNESGLPENGLIELRRAQEYFRLTPDERDDKRMILDIGNTYFLMGNSSEAVVYLEQALASFAPGSVDAAQSHEYLGRVYCSIGEYDAALKHLQSAIPIYDRVGNPQEAAQARGLMGQVYQQQGKLELARRYYRQALDTFQVLSDGLNKAAVHYALGQLELKEGNYDVAEDYLRQSIDETENLRQVSTSRDLMAAFSATVHERYAAYIECLMHKHHENPNQGLDVLAFETSELARARSLSELLRDTQSTLVRKIDESLARQEITLRQSLRVKEDYRVALLGGDYKKEELTAVEEDLRRLEDQYKQVCETIRVRYPAYDQITRPTSLKLREIQEQLLGDDQTMLLEYTLGTDKSYLWAITRTEFASYELPGRSQIEDLTNRLYSSLTSPQPRAGEQFEQERARAIKAATELTSQLSQILLAPVADRLGKKRLLIVADGALQHIPFQSLAIPTRSGGSDATVTSQGAELRPLVLDHEIIYEPSASTLALVLNASGNRRSPAGSVAVIADPVFDMRDARIKAANTESMQATVIAPSNDEFTRTLRDVGVVGTDVSRLFASAQEAESIMALVPWRTGMKAVGFQANRALATGSTLSQYRVVHFATHAFLDDKHPQFSGILLSQVDQKGQPLDGFLRLQDIYNLTLPVDLVVLSACQTGLGKDVRGEGLIGLTRGFMYAGASGVVASLWKVDDEATAELMKHFYAGMFEKGLSPAAALREAQLAMRLQKRWHEPYYWAGFVIQGQYTSNNTMKRTRTVEWVAALGSFGAALSLTIIFVLRRRRRRNL